MRRAAVWVTECPGQPQMLAWLSARQGTHPIAGVHNRQRLQAPGSPRPAVAPAIGKYKPAMLMQLY